MSVLDDILVDVRADLAGAQESSRKAKQFALWSAIAACVLFGLLIALFIVGAVAGSNSNP